MEFTSLRDLDSAPEDGTAGGFPEMLKDFRARLTSAQYS